MSKKRYNCQWGFKCDKTWSSLANTEDPKVKFCTSCQQNVHKIDTEAELLHQINLNRCVYFSRLFVDNNEGCQYPIIEDESATMYIGEVRAEYVITPNKD